jgi:hypothetical protein
VFFGIVIGCAPAGTTSTRPNRPTKPTKHSERNARLIVVISMHNPIGAEHVPD